MHGARPPAESRRIQFCCRSSMTSVISELYSFGNFKWHEMLLLLYLKKTPIGCIILLLLMEVSSLC